MFRLSILGIAVLAMVATFAAAAGVRDSVPAKAAGFPQVTFTNSVTGRPVTVQADAHQGTVSLAVSYGTGSRLTAGAHGVFVTAPPATVCTNIGGLSFVAQPTLVRNGILIPGGPVCVGASDRVFVEPFGTGSRIYSTDGGSVDVTASPAAVAAAIAAVP